MREVRELIERRLADEANPPVPLNELWSIYDATAWEATGYEGSPRP